MNEPMAGEALEPDARTLLQVVEVRTKPTIIHRPMATSLNHAAEFIVKNALNVENLDFRTKKAGVGLADTIAHAQKPRRLLNYSGTWTHSGWPS
jgi:hypothetical protein